MCRYYFWCIYFYCSCYLGLGGDVFCLYFDRKSRSVRGINASGRSPKNLTLEHMHGLGYSQTHLHDAASALNVTVPGACSG